MTLKENIDNAIADMANRISGVAQAEIDRANVPKIITPGMAEITRRAAAEGAVLLKNNGVLPLAKGAKVSLFSRVSEMWFYVGYGSGGDVNRPYEVNLADGIRNCDALELNEELAGVYHEWNEAHPINHGYWGHWPFYYPEMPLTDRLVSRAAQISDAAVVTVGRSSGEDRDCRLTKGSYYLTGDERRMLDLTSKYFDKVIVLMNVGCIMDMAWLSDYGDRIGAVLYVWQGGMESGNAVADLLSGRVSPCGKLTDTIAESYEAYPSAPNFGGKDYNYYAEDIYVGYRYFETFQPQQVLFPFGFGLSYSEFKYLRVHVRPTKTGLTVGVTVKNTGACAAREIVQVYLQKPCAALGNPVRELAGFAKTKLLQPQESERLTVTVDFAQFASYDDCGRTGHPYCYVWEAGEYALYLGSNVRDNEKIYTYYQAADEICAECRQAAAPQAPFEIICAHEENGRIVEKIRNATTQRYDLAVRILNHLPPNIPFTGDRGIKLIDVKEGRETLEAFTAQLNLDELEAITRGDYRMNSPLGAEGNAGAFGGVLPSLREKGVPPVITTDGPSGIRLKASCSLLPNGTLLACTFDTALVEELYAAVSAEMKDRGTDVLLGPGLNIHRNPLCGRNFEYYSEDPYLTGKIGAAAVRGIQTQGVSACPKHFAVNSQEFRRTMCDSRLSERALREIYLRGFEICIKEGRPYNLMTSYNRINGVYGHYHYDLCTTILRGEWGYEGNVMTDWWMKSERSHEFPLLRDQAYRVRAQVDVLMPGGKSAMDEQRRTPCKPDGTLLRSFGKPDGILLGELQRSAMNVLRCALAIKL